MKFTLIKKSSLIQMSIVCEVLTNESKFDTVDDGKIKIECNKWLYLTIKENNFNLN